MCQWVGGVYKINYSHAYAVTFDPINRVYLDLVLCLL
jgi:hypothetical protein